MGTQHRFPPGPRGLPWLSPLLAMIRDPLGFFCEMSCNYGPLSHANVAGAHLYWVNEPSLIEELLVGNHKSSIKDVPTRELKVLVGQGLLTSEGELWKRQRKLAAPPFQPRRITGYERAMVGCAERAFSAYADGET
ncbi:MAG TPA: cytochrome P450, partial [Polyangiaceae bacterium]|nr:cytochrome P450 [Polyangiaceae bacterium]